MDDREVPHHFICPISLQIMKDPVTVATGITYDRESIQRWQFQAQNNKTYCPVTSQPLPIAADFTPNHNLRRLIQAWCASDQVVPPSYQYSSLQIKVIAINLMKNLKLQELQLESLKSLQNLASESENNRICFKEVGVVRAMVNIVVSCHHNGIIVGLKEALNILSLVGFTHDETRLVLGDHDRIVSALTWVLGFDVCYDNTTMKLHAIASLKHIINKNNAKSHVLERLKPDFFKTVVLVLQQRENQNFEKGIKDVLHVLLSTCAWPRNCSMMIQSGAVFELVELELGSPNKATTELIMSVLFHLCSSADGRAQLLGHAAGLAVITKRMGMVSYKVDERALMIISMISQFSSTSSVLQEMVRVGTVEKLCVVLQVNGRHSHARVKAREILKRHSNVWKDSPCLDLSLLTRYPR